VNERADQEKAKRYQHEGSLIDVRHAEVRLFCLSAMFTDVAEVTKFKKSETTDCDDGGGGNCGK
jgi:hypothetical protein